MQFGRSVASVRNQAKFRRSARDCSCRTQPLGTDIARREGSCNAQPDQLSPRSNPCRILRVCSGIELAPGTATARLHNEVRVSWFPVLEKFRAPETLAPRRRPPGRLRRGHDQMSLAGQY